MERACVLVVVVCPVDRAPNNLNFSARPATNLNFSYVCNVSQRAAMPARKTRGRAAGRGRGRGRGRGSKKAVKKPAAKTTTKKPAAKTTTKKPAATNQQQQTTNPKKQQTTAPSKRKPSQEEPEHVPYDLTWNPTTLQTRLGKLTYFSYRKLPKYTPADLLRPKSYVLTKTKGKKAVHFLAEVCEQDIDLFKPNENPNIQVKNLSRGGQRKLSVPKANCLPVPKKGKHFRRTEDNVWFLVTVVRASLLQLGVRKVFVTRSYYEELKKNPPTPVQHAGMVNHYGTAPPSKSAVRQVPRKKAASKGKAAPIANQAPRKQVASKGKAASIVKPEVKPGVKPEVKVEDMRHSKYDACPGCSTLVCAMIVRAGVFDS